MLSGQNLKNKAGVWKNPSQIQREVEFIGVSRCHITCATDVVCLFKVGSVMARQHRSGFFSSSMMTLSEKRFTFMYLTTKISVITRKQVLWCTHDLCQSLFYTAVYRAKSEQALVFFVIEIRSKKIV